jgi:hypothetical protein
MPGEWIKMRVDLSGEPEVIGIAERLKLSPDAVVGKLLRVWGWASKVTADGRVPFVSAKYLDKVADRKGFADAMAAVGWLAWEGDTTLVVPNFDRHMSEGAKARALNTARQQARREVISSRSCHGGGATNAGQNGDQIREEKIREENTLPPYPPPGGGGPWPKVPDSLAVPEFDAAWREWIAFRFERKPRVTPLAAKQALKFLEKIGVQRAVAAIEHSIANSWQGIFEPDGRRGAGGAGVGQSGASRVRAEPGKYAGVGRRVGAAVPAAGAAPGPAG